MSSPITEVATIPIQPGAAIEDLDLNAGKVWAATLDTVSQQEGYQRAYYGREIENSNVLQLLVDWDSYEAHQNFIKSPQYEPFSKHLMTIVDGSIDMRHVQFDPHPPSAAVSSSMSPVTEVLTAYLAEKDDQYPERAKKFGEILSSKASGFRGIARGWVFEEIAKPDSDDEKGPAYMAVIGWESVEKHMQVSKPRFPVKKPENHQAKRSTLS